MSVVPEYRLLNEFAETFRGKVYRHRNSNIGNLIAIELYEDLYALGKSRKLVERIDQKQCTINVEGKLTGVSLRRADGTFGERNPSIPAVEVADHAVARSHLATVEIGIEVKIISKAMIKQVDRVQGDLENRLGISGMVAGIPSQWGSSASTMPNDTPPSKKTVPSRRQVVAATNIPLKRPTKPSGG